MSVNPSEHTSPDTRNTVSAFTLNLPPNAPLVSFHPSKNLCKSRTETHKFYFVTLTKQDMSDLKPKASTPQVPLHPSTAPPPYQPTTGPPTADQNQRPSNATSGYISLPVMMPSHAPQQHAPYGYGAVDPPRAERPTRDAKWAAMEGTPGCCFGDSGGCCFSSHGACCFSDHGACCCSDHEACCFADDRGCCFSDNGGACFNGCGGNPFRRS